MLLRGRRLHIALLIIAAAACLFSPRLSRGIQNSTDVVLPQEGKLDERPFFSTRRHPAIAYSERPSTDVVGAFVRRVDSGEVHLQFQGSGGYLNSVLEGLHVPTETQAVVFSKTSLQSHYISPSNPRALFFTDDISVAFIRNAPLLEIAALDPQQGVVFYALSNRKVDQPQITRSDSCTSCHESHETMDVPGYLARSVGAGTGGETLEQFGSYISDHRSPFEERWGGWFITGKTGTARHMGNLMLPEESLPDHVAAAPPLASLVGKFDPAGYPTRYSDVAAVLVLDHQVRMTNMMIRTGWETRVALDQAAKHPQDKVAANRVIASDAHDLADYMLFVDETPLPGKFESTSGFALKFAASGPRDKQGRSLRQLDLGNRLMRYPCSYMIYSPAFDGMPGAAKDAVYARMWEILSGKDKDRKYARLTAADRAAVVGILLQTKKDLPKYFHSL